MGLGEHAETMRKLAVAWSKSYVDPINRPSLGFLLNNAFSKKIGLKFSSASEKVCTIGSTNIHMRRVVLANRHTDQVL